MDGLGLYFHRVCCGLHTFPGSGVPVDWLMVGESKTLLLPAVVPTICTWEWGRQHRDSPSLMSVYNCLLLLEPSLWIKRHYLITEQSHPHRIKASFLSPLPLEGEGCLHGPLRQFCPTAGNSVSLSAQMGLEFLCLAIWSGYAKRKLYPALCFGSTPFTG